MATSPNDVRLQVIMKIREELDMEAALEEEMLGSQPDNPLVDHGREILERLTGADMRNTMQMLGARHKLQCSMAEKVLDLLEHHPNPCKPAHFSASLHPS
ncbi:hypothetical protein Tco_0610961 [Tanacetum coccineum]